MEVADGRGTDVVAVPVPTQVEARAGAHLEQTQRPRGLRGDGVEADEQRGRPAHLVGLWGRAQPGPQTRRPVAYGVEHGRPRRIRVGVAARRGEVGRDVGRPSLERESVQPREEAQCDRVLAGIALVPDEDVEHGAAGFDVGCGPGHELGVERGAQLAARAGLEAQSPGQHLLRSSHG